MATASAVPLPGASPAPAAPGSGPTDAPDRADLAAGLLVFAICLALYVLFIHLLPFGDAAYRMNLMSAVFAALLLRVSTTFWSQSVMAEVYAPDQRRAVQPTESTRS